MVEEWIACDSPLLSNETQFSDKEWRDGYVFPRLAVAPSNAFTTDFSFVNLIEHKAEEIVGFTVIESTRADASPWLGSGD